MSLHWKMQTSFPFSRAFVLGIILFFFGLASMVISVVSFMTQSWGHYVGTGMWGGAMILMSGMAAVFASRLKSLISVKTFCLCSFAAVISSLAMLILSAGGLTLNSGFYSRLDPPNYSKRTSNLIHASLLVISVFCLSGNVVAVIVCCKYLFFEHYSKSKHRRRHRNPLREGSSRTAAMLRGGGSNTVTLRASTDSRTPLQCSEPSHRRHSDHVDINLVQMEYRRTHRRMASDQQHASHSRRHRQCQGHSQSRLNVLSPDTSVVSARYNVDKRRSHSRVPGHQMLQETRANSKEREKLNIEPVRHVANPNKPASNQFLHSCVPKTAAYSRVRLPTDFNEEELPPYEPMEEPRPRAGRNISTVDSGDESDTENSSSTEAHSYDADASCIDGGVSRAEAVGMVNLRQHDNQRGHLHKDTGQHSDQEQITSFIKSPAAPLGSSAILSPSACEQNLDSPTSPGNGSRSIPLTISGEEVNLISIGVSTGGNALESSRSDCCVLRFAAAHPIDPSGDYERLRGVSPEVCAINGESPPSTKLEEEENPPVIQPEEHIPHEVNENFYENGPFYENCQQIGRSGKLNQLSKSSVSSSSKAQSCAGSQGRAVPHLSSPKVKSPVSSSAAQVCTFTQSKGPTLVSSNSFQSNICSSFSAFKPVGASSLCTSQNISPATPQSPLSSALPGISSPAGLGAVNLVSEARFHSPVECATSLAKKYEEQGAKPKMYKANAECFSVSGANDHANMSWKNIPLPHSYNHTDCASCEPEDKLPSKFIPFTDPLKRTSLSPSSNAQPQAKSPSSNLFQSQASTTGESSHPFGAVAQSILSPSAQSDRPNPEVSVMNSAMTRTAKRLSSSFQEASIGASSPVSSTQAHTGTKRSLSLLQNRREEPTSLDLSKHAVLDSKTQQSSSTQTNWKPGLAIGTVALRSTRLVPRFQTCFSSVRNGNKTPVLTEPNGVERPPQRSAHLIRENAGVVSGEATAEGDVTTHPPSLMPLLTSRPSSMSRAPLQVQPSNLLLRQNPLIQHYPLQPQQPRLGVQLHQRRHQQHQLQQNIESQQQQHQRQREEQQQNQHLREQQQQNQHLREQQGQQHHHEPVWQDGHQEPSRQPQQPTEQHNQGQAGQAVNVQNPNDRQQLRNGRPLFSVLL